MHAWLSAIQSGTLARAITDTPGAIAALSAVHALAFAVLMGCVILANGRALGWLLPDQPLDAVVRPAWKVLVGAVISITLTGAALALPRIDTVSVRPAFGVKLACAIAALMLQRRLLAMSRGHADPAPVRRTGAMAALMWYGSALAACAFILLE